MKFPILSFLKALLRGDIGEIYVLRQNAKVTGSKTFRAVASVADGKHGRKYRARIVNLPPPHLFWVMNRPATTAAAFIKRAYCRALWRERSTWDKAKLLAVYLLWPFIFILMSLWATALNGRAISQRTGVSVSRQLWGQLKAAWLHGALPPWFYMFEMYLPERFAKADQFIHRFETKGGIYSLMLPPGAAAKLPSLSDKIEFGQRCIENNLPVPREYLTISADDKSSTITLPSEDLFIKPFDGRGGSGAQSWLYKGSDLYQSVVTGETINSDELITRLRAANTTFIVQSRMVNHPDVKPLSNGALVTVRMMTFLNERGEYEATHAGLRMARGTNNLVDNFHAGGIIAAVDMKTGTLGPASDIGFRPDIGWVDVHPETGAQISGRQLPLWAETIALACRAHHSFAPRAVIGWDIAITEKGPVIIEGNSAPDVDLLQRSHRAPLGGTRFCDVIAFQLKQQPATIALIGTDL